MAIKLRIGILLPHPGLMGNVVLVAVLKQWTESTFLMKMFTGIAHMTPAGKGIAIVEGPDNGLFELIKLCEKFRREKAMVDPVQVYDICIFNGRVLDNRTAKPLQGERGFKCLNEELSQISLCKNVKNGSCFLKYIFAECAGFGAFLELHKHHYTGVCSLVAQGFVQPETSPPGASIPFIRI